MVLRHSVVLRGRRLTVGLLAGVSAFVVTLCAGGALALAVPGVWTRAYRVTAPAVLPGGLRLVAPDPDGIRIASQLSNQFYFDNGARSVVTGYYRATGTATLLAAADRVTMFHYAAELPVALASVQSQDSLNLDPPRGFPPGPRGGVVECASGTQYHGAEPLTPVSVCAWADHTTFGAFVFPTANLPSAATAFLPIRAAVEHP